MSRWTLVLVLAAGCSENKLHNLDEDPPQTHPSLVVEPDALNFAGIERGTSAVRLVTITNTGPGVARIDLQLDEESTRECCADEDMTFAEADFDALVDDGICFAEASDDHDSDRDVDRIMHMVQD